MSPVIKFIAITCTLLSIFYFQTNAQGGPSIITAQIVERLLPGPGIDTMFVTFSEAVQVNSLTGNALILIQNGISSELSIIAASFLTNTKVKLVVSEASTVPQLGDSLRIDPTGPIMDVLNIKTSAQNMPVVITPVPIHAAIVQAYYLDKNADGIVDAVRIDFSKVVSLTDLILSLKWGAWNFTFADSIAVSRISYSEENSMGIEINIRGAFKSISADSIKTSGSMLVIAGFISLPGASVDASVADSTAPVIVSAKFLPGSTEAGTVNPTDTLVVVFSEPIASIGSTMPFQLKSKSNNLYAFSLVIPQLLGSDNSLKFVVKQIQGVVFPQNGDSIWIDPSAGVGDAGFVIQNNPNNRRGVLSVQASVRPDTTTTKTKSKSGCGSGIGLAFIPPIWFKTRSLMKRRISATK
jgi:hypothetical protein